MPSAHVVDRYATPELDAPSERVNRRGVPSGENWFQSTVCGFRGNATAGVAGCAVR